MNEPAPTDSPPASDMPPAAAPPAAPDAWGDGSGWSDRAPDVWPSAAAPAPTATIAEVEVDRFDPLPGTPEAERFDAIPGEDSREEFTVPLDPAVVAAELTPAPSAAEVTEQLRAHLAAQPGGACPFCGGTSYASTVTPTIINLECNGCGWQAAMNAARVLHAQPATPER